MKLTYQKQKSKSQSGRSMAEILGVLALIGVLSLGALSGYAWAMNKYRSNVLTQEILERASDIKGQLDQRHRHITLDKWDSISLIGYEIGLEDNQAVTEGTKTTAAIQVKGVKEEVCQMTFDNLAKMMSIEIRQEDGVALGTASDKCQDGCTMVFFLDDEWEYSRTAPVQPACDVNTMPKGANPETCECDAETQMEVDGQCVCLNGDIPLNGLCVECVTEEDCNSGNYVCENHTCSCVKQDCPNSDFADTICSCCPDDKPIWIEEEGVCKSCAEIDLTKPVYNKETKECEACPDGTMWDGAVCVSCPDDKPIWNDITKTCEACPDDKQVWDEINERCVECLDNSDCGTGFVCTDNQCTCETGSETRCASDLIETVIGPSAYGQLCYTCSCPDGSTLSGNTCICTNECKTYNASTKTCVNKTDGTTCSTGLCKTGVCTKDTCPTGTAKTCSANLVATASSKTAYGTQCYKCGCPSGATLSGTTCVCNNECQTYNTSTKACTNKSNGTTCSSGLCKNGTCTNDTCPSGTVKTCSSGTANKVSTTTYGSACYRCCSSPKTYWNGSACACPTSTPKYANTSTCACNSGETNKNGVCTPDLYSPCATYCQTRNSTSSGTFQNCRNMTTTSKLNLVLYLQHTVSANGTKSYTLVSSNTLKTNGANETYTYPLSTGKTYFETFCEYGYATYKGSYYYLEWTKASSNSLCNGLISGSSASCYTSNSKEISNAQKTTCNPFCNKYASRYGW